MSLAELFAKHRVARVDVFQARAPTPPPPPPSYCFPYRVFYGRLTPPPSLHAHRLRRL